jgi:3',5'-cyclic AMP phosphodiesterase CpdA
LHWLREDLGALRLIGLDVTVPGEHHGLFDSAAADWLAAALGKDPERPTLIFMHQPPLMIGIAALDELRCFGDADLAATLAHAPGVLALCCGHVHRLVMGQLAGVPVITAPSLAPAIALRLAPDASPASQAEPPGFLLHAWTGSQLVTHLIPVGDFPGPWDFY